MKRSISLVAAGLFATAAQATVFPTGAHAAFNFIPFGNNQTATQHQVFASTLFSNATGGLAANITSIGFAPQTNGTYGARDITLRLGYTTRIPGVASGAGGLSIPTAGGGGTPNAVGAMTTFYSNPSYVLVVTAASSTNFSEFVLPGSFIYNPANGNLLVEIVTTAGAAGGDLAVSRAAGSAESSRAYTSTRFAPAESPTTATRMDFTFTAVPEPGTMIALGAGLAALISRRRRR